jgi:hypothetical protein
VDWKHNRQRSLIFALSRTGVRVLKNHGSTCIEFLFVIIIKVKTHWTSLVKLQFVDSALH